MPRPPESYLDVPSEPRPDELLDMIAAQRRLIAQLRSEDSPRPEELAVHERTLRFLMDELQRRGPQSQDGLGAAIAAADALADIFHFPVPPSHRGVGGRAITAAKRAVLGGLKPFHTELLRPQRELNIHLVATLRELVARSGSGSPEAAQRVRVTLGSLANPGMWRGVRSHRSGVLGDATDLAKRSYLRLAGSLLRQVLEGQRRWNLAAVEALAAYAGGDTAAATEAERRVSELDALADPLARGEVSRAVKASRPLWTEVFRRQTEFNRQIALALGALFHVSIVKVDYPAWCAAVEPPQLRAAAEAVASLGQGPLFSIVTPTYETPEPALRACIESVLQQSYPRWELCLADDGSKDPRVAAVLDEYARRDSRIHVARLGGNGGIAKATNAALAMAKGDFVAFLDHDDTLAPLALAENALRLDAEPSLDLLYSDEDKLDPEGRRVAPLFKPDWSPDLLRSCNYICHLMVVRRRLLEEVGGLREGFDGAQDFDLTLRLTERTQRIAHLPRVLYHWRMSATSTAQDVRNKPAASSAGRRALAEHLRRCGEEGTVEEPLPTTYRIRYPVRGSPLVSIIVPFKDKPELLQQLVRTLLGLTRYPNYELLLVSNNSSQPETFALLDSLTDPRIRKLTWDHPFNYSAICNYGASQARGELLLFLNNDIEIVDPEWLEELIGQAQRPEVGMVGPKLLFPNGTLQHAGVVLGVTGFAAHVFSQMSDARSVDTAFGHQNWTRNYLAVTGACAMIRRSLFEQIGGYDERFLICGSDVEICLRLVEKGLRVVYTPGTKLIHHESASRRSIPIPENDYWRSLAAYRRYLREGDPYYNPNLSLENANGALRTEPRSGEALALELLTTGLPSSRASPLTRARVEHQKVIMRLAGWLDYSPGRAPLVQGVSRSARAGGGKVERVTWLVPYFLHPYGGIHTILRFGHLWQERHGVRSRFVIYDNPSANVQLLEAKVAAIFPRLEGTLEVVGSPAGVGRLEAPDVAIATSWMSAYPLFEHAAAPLKAYFIQDHEPGFYAASTLSALAEETYRMGLYAIVNTPGLFEYVTSSYPLSGCWFEPTVEHGLFHDERPPRAGPVRVFFYARPTVDRNGFELGMVALRELKRALGEKVELLAAGESWSPEDYGMAGQITNLGVLPYEKTADLYRECDVGLCFMFTKHPSYLPLEMMACGVTVVTNENAANRWLLEHERNCLLARPVASSVLQQLRRAVTDRELRARLGAAAAERVRRTTWEEQADKVYEALRQQRQGPAVEDVPPGLELPAQEGKGRRV